MKFNRKLGIGFMNQANVSWLLGGSVKLGPFPVSLAGAVTPEHTACVRPAVQAETWPRQSAGDSWQEGMLRNVGVLLLLSAPAGFQLSGRR